MLSAADVHQYHDDGFAIVPSFLDTRECNALVNAFHILTQSGAGRDVMPLPDKQNILFTPLDDAPLFRALPFAPKVIDAVRQLIGEPLLLWHDQIYLKPAGVGVGNSWHEDNARFKIADVTRGTGLWIAIHEASRANGTLELVPGSWRQSRLSDAFRLPTSVEDAGAIAAEIPAGGAVFFNFGVLHCTRDNHSAAPRAAVVYHFLNGNHRPASQFLPFGKNLSLEISREEASVRWSAAVEHSLTATPGA